MNAQATFRAAGRGAIKSMAGRIAAAMLRQCDYSRALLLLGHMRCGSTALSNVLCSHPSISGYGEAHIRHDGPAALGRLVVNQRKRRAWNAQGKHLFDKVLHNRYDDTAFHWLFAARAVFLVREPVASLLSIRRLFAEIGSGEYAGDEDAADYYEQRLGRLSQLWPRFAPDRRIGLTYAGLIGHPEAALGRISAMLALAPPLTNRYVHKAQARGAGDPLEAHRFSAIVQAVPACAAEGSTHLALSAARLSRLQGAYAEFCALID